ncbi:MAG: SpoVR family protein, partial [Candidimonas sp.]
RLFMITDDASKSHIDVSAIHDNDGYRRIRKTLARSYNLSYTEPDIQVDDVDVRGDRCLRLIHKSYNGIPIDRDDTDEVLKHLALLWGYDVRMASNDSNTGRSLEWFHIKKS